MTNDPLLLCSDLDRTLIPNGEQPESFGAMDLLRSFVSRPNVTLAYVTGRHRELVVGAMQEYQLPPPDYVISDVGSRIYSFNSGDWEIWQQWEREIGVAWAGMSGNDIHEFLQDISELKLQEPQKQNRFKLSYYVPLGFEQDELEREIATRLQAEGVRAALVWSIDNAAAVGLLDVLPEAATKLHAVEFLQSELEFNIDNTVFAGDSGNDISVLASPIRSVLVANATDEVRQQAIKEAEAKGHRETVYLARGGFNGTNGNYSAGIMEGVVHYFPQYESLLRR